MTKLLCFALLLVVLSTAPALADLWGPLKTDNYNDQTTLLITRNATGANEWEWTFTLYHGAANATPLHQFSVGLLADDTNGMGLGDINSGHYYGYSSSIAGTTCIETSGNAMWLGFALAYGQNATFSFKTDLPSVGLASHIARDHTYTPIWDMAQTPVVPEPGSILVLATGLVGLIVRLRKK